MKVYSPSPSYRSFRSVPKALASVAAPLLQKLPLALQEKWSDALAADGALAVSGRDADDAEMESGEAAAAQIMLRGNPGLRKQQGGHGLGGGASVRALRGSNNNTNHHSNKTLLA